MTSSSADRVEAIYQSYSAARDNMDADMVGATDAQAARIRKNLAELKAAYYTAEEKGLAANGADVEAAYQAAAQAAAKVQQAYEDGKALSDRIRAVSGAVTAVAGLVQKAALL
jgi:hypothetical protein